MWLRREISDLSTIFFANPLNPPYLPTWKLLAKEEEEEDDEKKKKKKKRKKKKKEKKKKKKKQKIQQGSEKQ